MFNYRAVIQQAIAQEFFDGHPDYPQLQIGVKSCNPKPGEWYWRAICGYKMTRAEGGGNPNIYLACVDNTGKVMNVASGWTMQFAWDWTGRRPDEPHRPVNGDKPDNEPPANINLGKGQIVQVAVVDPCKISDVVYNLRSDWPDALYHSATFVCWKLTKAGEEPEPDPEPEPQPDEWQAGYQAGKAAAVDATKRFLDAL